MPVGANLGAGYVQPADPNLYLDAEDTGRTVAGWPVVLQRVKDDAVAAALAALLAAVDGLEGSTDGIEGALATLNSRDFATQSTLAAVLTALAVSQPRDVIDRTARLLGHVTVDNFPAGGTGLTDAELRATAVPVSGPLTDAQLRATAVAVSGALTDAQLRAAAVPVSQASQPLPTGAATESTVGARFAGGKLSKGAQVTASGDTTIHTPASGKAIRLYWVSAINDPDAAASPRITVKWATSGAELYRAYAVAHWEIFQGAVDEPLAVNLDQAGDVAVTLHYAEI